MNRLLRMLYEQIAAELKILPPVWEENLESIGRSNAIVSNKKIKACGYVFKYPHLSLRLSDDEF